MSSCCVTDTCYPGHEAAAPSNAHHRGEPGPHLGIQGTTGSGACAATCQLHIVTFPIALCSKGWFCSSHRSLLHSYSLAVCAMKCLWSLVVQQDRCRGGGYIPASSGCSMCFFGGFLTEHVSQCFLRTVTPAFVCQWHCLHRYRLTRPVACVTDSMCSKLSHMSSRVRRFLRF